MIMKKMFLSSVAVSLCLTGCKDVGWDPGGPNPPISCNPASTPNDSDPYTSHLVYKNNGVFKPSAKPLQRLNGIVPALVKTASDKGEVAADSPMSITVAMKLNHEKELNQMLREMYDPKSPNYRHFLATGQFAEKFGPTQGDVEKVKNLLVANGFKSVTVDPNRLLVSAQGTVASVNQTFNTEVHSFKDKAGKSFYAPTYELQVPFGYPIQAVHGLDNTLTWHAHYRESPVTRSGPGGGLTPAQTNQAYSIPTTVTGSGQTVALFELDGYAPSDIQGFEQGYHIPAVPLQNVLVSGASGRAGSSTMEVVLDIELMMGLAPGMSKIMVYEGQNSTSGALATYNKIASDNLASIVSISWGTTESSTPSSLLQSENTIFKQMAAQGQSVYAASGDSGAYDDGQNLGVDDPGSQPYVVGVGGTMLTPNSDGSYGTESSWNSNGGGGGGISDVWTIPSWQAGLANSQNMASSTMRNVPDVSLNADPDTGYSIYVNGGWAQVGGTSCAAPLWAAFTALVNQQRIQNALAPLGFANTAIYQIGNNATTYAKDFHDINDGSTNLYYPAVTGYDDSTGWGTINGTSLLADLAGNSTVVNPTPAPSPTASPAPTATPMPTATPSPTATPAPTPTGDPTSTPMPTPTASPTPTPTGNPTSTPTPSPTTSPSPVPPCTIIE